MARHPRLVVPGYAHHVLQRGVSGQALFSDDDDHAAFLAWLQEGARRFSVAIHAYALMPHAVQLLATPIDAEGFGRMMQWIGRHYVPWFNRRHGRAGALWSGRFKATVLDANAYLLPCSIFVERMPTAQGLIEDPVRYRWSSCAHHANGVADAVVTDHSLYWSLGNTPFEREAAYRELLDKALTDDMGNLMAAATERAWAIGSTTFVDMLEKQMQRPVVPRPRGRPRRVKPAITDSTLDRK
ncbi:MAG: transposase [Herminiimonas sp.]|nr:transposase [Herminiimonas sp.]